MCTGLVVKLDRDEEKRNDPFDAKLGRKPARASGVALAADATEPFADLRKFEFDTSHNRHTTFAGAEMPKQKVATESDL